MLLLEAFAAWDLDPKKWTARRSLRDADSRGSWQLENPQWSNQTGEMSQVVRIRIPELARIYQRQRRQQDLARKTLDFPLKNVGFSRGKQGFSTAGKKNAEGVLGIFPNQKKKNDRSHCGMVAPPSNLVGRGVTIDYFSAIKWEHFWGLMMIKLYFTVYPDVGLSENGYPYINPLFNHNYISFLDLL